ncbi:piRNA biogenesis protein EXD1-like [Mantella aurantiaca]
MDSTSNKSFLSDIIGKTIKITTTNGYFQGVLFSVHEDRACTLIKAKDLTTGEALRGARLFFGQNVLNVEPVEESTNAGQEVEGETLEERSCTQPLKIAQSIHQEEPSNVVRAIKRAVDNEEVVYTVINQFQTMFQSTVIHDCRWLGDILSHQYGVNLNNVFDTQVGDVYLFSVETGGFLPHRTSTMKECLTRYLNMPSTQVNFLNIKQTLMKENPNMWSDRPMSATLLKVLALEVLHLLNLRQAMLDGMLADFTLLVDSYLNAPCPERTDDLDRTEISCSVLPKELQQLCVLQQRRREQALKEYNVNSQGFLTRSENEKPRSHDL